MTDPLSYSLNLIAYIFSYTLNLTSFISIIEPGIIEFYELSDPLCKNDSTIAHAEINIVYGCVIPSHPNPEDWNSALHRINRYIKLGKSPVVTLNRVTGYLPAGFSVTTGRAYEVAGCFLSKYSNAKADGIRRKIGLTLKSDVSGRAWSGIRTNTI